MPPPKAERPPCTTALEVGLDLRIELAGLEHGCDAFVSADQLLNLAGAVASGRCRADVGCLRKVAHSAVTSRSLLTQPRVVTTSGKNGDQEYPQNPQAAKVSPPHRGLISSQSDALVVAKQAAVRVAPSERSPAHPRAPQLLVRTFCWRSPQALIDRGGNVHAFNQAGETPLHTAAKRGATEVAKVLIEHGLASVSQPRPGAPVEMLLGVGHVVHGCKPVLFRPAPFFATPAVDLEPRLGRLIKSGVGGVASYVPVIKP